MCCDTVTSASIDEEQVCEVFDRLVERNVILHGPETITRTSDKGFNFEFRVCKALASKPSSPSQNFRTNEHETTFGPGSDLFNPDPGLTVTQVNDTHLLVLNRFSVFRPQYLVLTRDSYRRQTEPLDEQDLAAGWSVLQRLASEHFAIFNGGLEAGCSRLHKHLQVLPTPFDFKMFPDVAAADAANVPYKYFLEYIATNNSATPADSVNETLLQIYSRLYSLAKTAWTKAGNEEKGYVPHNVVLTKRWMMVIPRKKAMLEGASANAAGMMGMVWVMSEDQKGYWERLGGWMVLSELGIPAHHQSSG